MSAAILVAGAMQRQIDGILPRCVSWGVRGLTFGFAQARSQAWTRWLHNAARKGAAHCDARAPLLYAGFT